MKRFVSIWFRYLVTDWFSLQRKELKKLPFVLTVSSHGKMIVNAVNAVAERRGIFVGMPLADARAIVPDIQVADDKPDLIERLLKRIGEWCIRFTPIVSVNAPDGLIFDATGCAHLWGGEEAYVSDITKRLQQRGYDVRVAIADTVGVAWAVARYGKREMVVPNDKHIEALSKLPPEGLRLEPEIIERLHKLGLRRIQLFMKMPRQTLRRRFGPHLLSQLDKALGQEMEVITPVIPPELYYERLPCLEPIVTATGIQIALEELLKRLCLRLSREQKGMRMAILKAYRVDNKVEQIKIATNRPTHHVQHLFKLFETKLSRIAPALGIELFVLEAPVVEDHLPSQEKMWEANGEMNDERLSELIDRLASKIGSGCIHRYLPAEHYWPERSFKLAQSLEEKATSTWRADKRRPIQLLEKPEHIDVTAPIPDYPPMVFNYQGKVHRIVKADGPERIEQEWWIQQGQHRDYYCVEDEEGNRYWIFRLGHYDDKKFEWFVHGFFA